MQRPPFHSWLSDRTPLDFAVAAVLALCANFLVCDVTAPGLDSHVRIQSQRLMLAKVRTSPDEPVDLVMFGDSRARQLDVDVLCRSLYGEAGRCINASTTGGDWVTAYQIYRAGADRNFRDSDVMVFPSDFWVEGNERITLPRTVEYAELGQIGDFLVSWFPLSRARGPWMGRTHYFLSESGQALLDRFAPAAPRPTLAETRARAMPEIAGWRDSNIERWYAPTDDDQRALLRRAGERFLKRLVADRHRVVMVDLPYPDVRERYLDRFHPGRRRNAIDAIDALARGADIPLIDMRDEIRHHLLFKDLNHLSYKGLTVATERLVERMRRLEARGNAAHAAGDG